MHVRRFLSAPSTGSSHCAPPSPGGATREPRALLGVSQLLELTQIVAGKITKIQRKSLGALITIDVHSRDVTASMRDQGVSLVTDFAWISQLRYELAADNGRLQFGDYKEQDTLVRQLDGCFVYGCEYMGNSMRLVVTPLTDRIYLTLTGAL